jgi:hypothetical protein
MAYGNESSESCANLVKVIYLQNVNKNMAVVRNVSLTFVSVMICNELF